MAEGTAASVEQLVNRAIQQYRAKLIDLSSRNPLISFRHSERSRSHVRVVDEIPEKLFAKLQAGRQLTFDCVPEPDLMPADEALPLFADTLRRAKRNDQGYLDGLAELGPNPSDRKKRKVERELRNRVRAEMGLAPFEPEKDARARAAELGINVDWDLAQSEGQSARRYNDLKIQTLFFRDDLERKLGALREAARILLQDAGINALYCAFGYLEYYESPGSDEKRVAPLVFFPVSLDRELESGEYRYFIEGRNDEIEINVALKELLQQFNLDLPAWVDAEDEPNPLEDYFARVEQVIRNRPDWKLRRYVTVGLFTFSTLAMYKDLDPGKWPECGKLELLELIRTLVAGAEVHGAGVADDYDIDELKEPEPLFITDADSSQHSAVLDVLRGRNCVIQGPPGTGKSQTITNLIAAAIHGGKSVLFVAEKMAALEVVKKRLTAAGLDAFCLELHSSKTSRAAVVESLNKRLECRPALPSRTDMESNLEALHRARGELIHYVQRANEPAGRTGLRIRDILLGSATRERTRAALPTTFGTARFADALSITPQLRNEMLSAASNLEEQTKPLASHGNLAGHPWRGLQNSEITEFETDQLLESLRAWESRLLIVAESVAKLSDSTGTAWPGTERNLNQLCHQVKNLPIADELVRAEIFCQLGTPEVRVHLQSAIAAVKAVIQEKSTLLELVLDPAGALAVGSARVQEACHALGILKLKEGTLIQLREMLKNWQAVCADLETAADASVALARKYGVAWPTLGGAGAGCAGVELLRSISRERWLQREAPVLEESNETILRAAAAQCTTLLRRRAALAEAFDLSLLPPPGELRQGAVALRSANFITAMFNGECRRAKNVYRAVSRRKRRSPTRTEVVDGLLGCAVYVDDERQFLNDPEVKRACGQHFKGLSTPFPTLLQLNSWSSGVRQQLAAFGEAGSHVRDFLFTASVEGLDRLNASAAGSGYEALLKILSQFKDEQETSFINLSSRQRDRHGSLSAAVETLASATVRDSAAIGQLPKLVSSLKSVEQQTRSIEGDAGRLKLVGGSVKAAECGFAALEATLAYAERVGNSGLPSGLVEYLFQDLGRIVELKHSEVSLAEALNDVRRAAESASALAKFDSRLWCGAEGLDSADARDLALRCHRATDNSAALQDYINFLLAEETARDTALGPVLMAFIEGKEDYRGLADATDLVFYRSAAEQILNSDPRLKRHSGSTHEQVRKQYQRLDREYLQLQRKRLASALRGRAVPEGNHVGRVADLTELALVQHVSGQTRPRIHLRDLFRRAGTAIKALKPCWMMSPMSVAQFLEPGALVFDLVIMDEASQIRPEEALGAIARARQMVVVGDQMQLPPTPFFQKLSSDGGADSEDDEDVDVKQESILETAAARFFPPRRLKWHYRSEHGSLISFSNSEFYDDQLTVFPSPHHDHPDYGVKLVSVSGIYGAGVNQMEAVAVIEAAAAFMREHLDQSLGIVAVNSKQAELIRERLDRLFASEAHAEAYRAKWADGLESVFVKNLENVQGDERDVIFISTVYGKDEAGNFYQRFGPINSEYGHRRLNVLFTRAKKKVVVFTSMTPEDITDEGRHWGVRVLKAYLRYARDGQMLLAAASGGECENEFEQWVLQMLKGSGYDAVPQLGFAGYRIDIAVRHPKKPGMFICGVECDGAAYHSARSARERDRLRQEVLERLGWNIYRIWSTDWFRNPSLQTKNLVDHLRRLSE